MAVDAVERGLYSSYLMSILCVATNALASVLTVKGRLKGG